MRYDVWPGLCSAVIHAEARAPLTRTAHPRAIVRLRPARLRFDVQPDLPDTAIDADRLQAPLRGIRMPDYERWGDFLETLRGVTIDYDEQIGFDIPDAGWLQIFVSPTDLRAGRFDRVCSVFNTT